VDDLRSKLDRLLAERARLIREVEAEEATLADALARVGTALEAQRLVQQVAGQVQESCHRQVASVVSRCLTAVFGHAAYEFRIRFTKKRGRTEAELLFVRDGLEADPATAAGGGVVDVAAFSLRLACLLLARPRRRRLLVLDEPFRMLSRDYAGRVKELLLTLAEELSVQMVIVTHNRRLACGKVIEPGGRE
jgi:energy-coupling factor transporter ATP-binding protein EcfA2